MSLNKFGLSNIKIELFKVRKVKVKRKGRDCPVETLSILSEGEDNYRKSA